MGSPSVNEISPRDPLDTSFSLDELSGKLAGITDGCGNPTAD
jgi:hypothetical protein